MKNKQKDKHDHSASAEVRRRDRMLNQIEVTRIQRLHAQGVSVAAIATHLGCARSTVYRWLAEARYRRQTRPQRDRLLAHRTWLAEQLTQHAGNLPVVHRLLAKEHGIEVRLRTVQRFAASWLAEQRRTAPAVSRFETLPGSQLQIDFGTQRVPIAGVHAPVHVLVAILGSSRRVYVQALPDETQASWWRGLEGAFRHFGGLPLEVLMDHAKALVLQAKRKDQTAVQRQFSTRDTLTLLLQAEIRKKKVRRIDVLLAKPAFRQSRPLSTSFSPYNRVSIRTTSKHWGPHGGWPTVIPCCS